MSLKQVFHQYFKVGAAVPAKMLDSAAARQALISQYDSITCENEMKPELVLDYEKNVSDPEKYGVSPAIQCEVMKKYLTFAKENGIGMRGHTLLWHNQTPEWFFHKDYCVEKELADRETMLKRMEGYIKNVLEFVQTEYPGVIYAWDVVNEAIEEYGLRKSKWTETVGDDFIVQAFRAARKYAAPGVSLFYNDYDTFSPWKRDLICSLVLDPLVKENLIDGMGMQTHLVMPFSVRKNYQIALERYGSYGIEVQITELDIHNTDSSSAGMRHLAECYKELFLILLKAKKEKNINITGVTFWGLNDDHTWLTGFRQAKSYPLLFDGNFNPKEAYLAVVSTPGIVEQDMEDRLPGGQRFAFWEKETVFNKEYHVHGSHPDASDDNDGTIDYPFKTIQAAANLAEPGTRVWIHGGEYRECVQPLKGGNGPEEMISYEAFGDGDVIIKASEITETFEESTGWNLNGLWGTDDTSHVKVWMTKLDPDKFRGYNPFCAVNILHDRLFIEYDKTDMTTYLNRRGMVFCDGKPMHQVALYRQLSEIPGSYWVEANGQKVHFRLWDDGNPADHLIELTCREQCFAPAIPFLNYIKVKGLTCAHAATGAPVPQRGAISCYRGHHWIIENCKIDWANGTGIDIGNECWHHPFDKNQVIGYTVVRGCEIKDVGVCGIAAMFAVNLLIEDNLIQGTGWQKMELSWEAGGMKAHNTVNSMIRRNIFKDTFRADHLWLDVGNENNRITRNLFLDGIEQREAIFIECSRDGVNLIDNNIFWKVEGRFDPAQVPAEPGSTGWYKMEEHSVVNGYAVYGEGTDRMHVVNNLIGKCRSAGYFAKPVAFRYGENSRGGTSREAKIFNNIFYDCGEAAIKFPTMHNECQGNLYVRMPAGYLRIFYPAPEVCLDLQAWKEFYGFDKNGQEGWFDIDVNTHDYTLSVKIAQENPWRYPHGTGKLPSVKIPENVEKVTNYPGIVDGFTNSEVLGCKMPGPFAELVNGMMINIDPRKKRK